MEQVRDVSTNGTSATNGTQATPKARAKTVYPREKQPVLSADDVVESSIRAKTSQIPQGWTSLDLGDHFRETAGGFIYTKVSCAKAYCLDTGKPMVLKPDQQMTKRVYQCWLTSF